MAGPMNLHMSDSLSEADRQSCVKMAQANPVWTGQITGSTAFNMPANLLLHAGPPFKSIEDISTPILHSAVVAAVYEGLANDFDTAEKLIRAGEIRLDAAQNHAVVTPLAAVVSASMPLHRVQHASDQPGAAVVAYAPINGGAAPSLRLGLKSDAVLEHIRWLNDSFADYLDFSLAQLVRDDQLPGVEMLPFAVAGLHHGDDCHGRTPVANQKLFDKLSPKVGGDAERINKFVQDSPSIFLNLWMAATKCILMSAEGVEQSSLLTAAGGNGVQSGIQISSFPGQWFVDTAGPPVGTVEQGLSQDRICGALGDSAIIEGFGLGAMAIKHSPEQFSNFEHVLPDDLGARLAKLPSLAHPAFASLNLSVGCCIRSVVASDLSPIVALGMIDRLGREGRIGGGIYQMPLSIFSQAHDSLEGAISGRA